MSNVVRSFKRALQKAPSIIAEFSSVHDPTARPPKWNPAMLYQRFEKSWVLQQIARTIIQEVKRPGWSVQPKFATKCLECAGDFPTKTDKCPRCGGKVREPDWKQMGIAEALLDKPNSSRQSFGDLLGSSIYHDIVMDMWYLSVAESPVYQKDTSTNKFVKTGEYKPTELYVEDSQLIQPIMDDRGRLRSGEWFCPRCWPEIDDDISKAPGKCRVCSGDLMETVYVQKLGNEIKNRFGLDQMVHGSTYKILPNYNGAPRVVSIWDIVWTLSAMDEWFFDTYKTGKLGKIINFPQYDPDQVKMMAIKLRESEAALDEIDSLTGDPRTSKKSRNLFIGSNQPIGVHDVINSPRDMMMMEYYTLGIRAACGVFGVQPIMIALEEGKGGGQTPFLKLEVNNHTTEEYQRDREAVYTKYLFPLFGVHDFEFIFGELEKKDELRDAKVNQIRAATVKTYVDAGFTVFMDKEGRVRVTGQGNLQTSEDGQKGPTGQTPRGEKESERSGALINETTTQRHNTTSDDESGMVV